VERGALAVVDGAEEGGIRREDLGHRVDVQGLEGAEETRSAHRAAAALSRRA
jgi:hypothetical protein